MAQKTIKTKKAQPEKWMSRSTMSNVVLVVIIIAVLAAIGGAIAALNSPKTYTIGGRVFTKLEDSML